MGGTHPPDRGTGCSLHSLVPLLGRKKVVNGIFLSTFPRLFRSVPASGCSKQIPATFRSEIFMIFTAKRMVLPKKTPSYSQVKRSRRCYESISNKLAPRYVVKKSDVDYVDHNAASLERSNISPSKRISTMRLQSKWFPKTF